MSRPRTAQAAAVLIVLAAVCPCAFALNPSLDIYQYTHKAWTVREGFFKGGITTIAQTPDGYLWLGSEFGLLRFDGVRAVEWHPPVGEHLPGTVIRSLLVARDGSLWIGTNNGLASWKDGNLTGYPALVDEYIQSLLEDREGVVWAGTYSATSGKLCAIHGGSAECYGKDGSVGSISSLYEDSRGNLWVGGSTGLWRWKPNPPKLYLTGGSPLELIEAAGGEILIATSAGIKRLLKGKVESYPVLRRKEIQAIHFLRDHDGGLWVGTANRGLVHVHQGKTEVFERSDGFSGDYVFSLFEDHEGNIWAATRDGLDRFRDPAVPTISVRQGLSDTLVGSVLATADGNVWLGTNQGLNQWNDGRITVYPRLGASFPFFQDPMSRIWVAPGHGTNYIYYFDDGRLTPVKAVPPGPPPWSIKGDSGGNVWISRLDGLFLLAGNAEAKRIAWQKLGRRDFAVALLPDSSGGGVWAGFYRGGLAYFKDGEVRQSYSAANGLGQGRVEALQRDPDGMLWAATEGGLSAIKDGRITTLNSRNGLPCDAVHWMVEDDEHAVWLYLACGLARITHSELQRWESDPRRIIAATVFDVTDGVTSFVLGTLYSPQVAKSKDGRIWFVSHDGVSVIDPKHVPVNNAPPPVHIEQIIADRKLYWQDFAGSAASSLHLPALSRDLAIDYTALGLGAPEKLRFKYKLEGRDRDWQDAGLRRQAFYNDLPPRKYHFRVVASNNGGVWNEAGNSLEFSIDAAYYQTSWFRALIVAIILGTAWGLYRLRLYQVAREFNMRLEERVSERTRLARDLHDTLLQSFHGLMLRFQVVNKLLPEGRAKEQLEATLERADQAIAEGRSAVYDLRSSVTTTNELSEALSAVANELSTEDTAEFGLVVEGSPRELHPIIRDELYRISREALRNAFKHARARHIEAEINYGEPVFRLRIRDDGEGIPNEFLEQGRPGHYGLPGIRERARQVGADLTIWSRPGSGTEIELNLAGSIAYGTSPRPSRLRIFGKKVG